MREAILTVGPRASGKSDFCEKAVAANPEVVFISRDQILVELFGDTSIDPYLGGHLYAMDQMWRTIEKKARLTPDLKMIVDAWNESSEERVRIIRKFRDLGADRVAAWYFITPVNYVREWFWKKPGIAKFSEMKEKRGKNLTFYSDNAPQSDHEMFHRLAANIDSDGFDEIVRIDPLITLPETVFKISR